MCLFGTFRQCKIYRVFVQKKSPRYIPRIAKARNLSVEQLTQLIAKYSQQPLVKYIGQPVVNIVELNLALDKLDE